jgi:Fe-S cluster biogenesis protein NfuA
MADAGLDAAGLDVVGPDGVGPDGVGPDGAGLTDAAVEARLARLDDVLGQLEQIPGRTAELALEAVETLTEVYGEALRRTLVCTEGHDEVRTALTADELLRHLLLLHGVHPDPAEARAGRAVDDLRVTLRKAGADVELVAVSAGVARVRISSGSSCGGCGSTAELEQLVREQVLTSAPELAGVEAVVPEPDPPLIPVSALLRRPGVVGVGG